MGAPVDLLHLTSEELGSVLTDLLRQVQGAAQPRYRIRQIRHWIYEKTPDGFEGMTDIPEALRRELSRSFRLHPLTPVERVSSRDGTERFAWQTTTGALIESVWIPEGDRITCCLSTQAGCPVGCLFCATGRAGYRGNLSAAEIVDQFVSMKRIRGAPPTNVVLMGMGEPLLNYRNVSRAIRILTSPEQIHLGARRVTLSTVGIPKGIVALARDHPQVRLALSIHTPTDRVRDRLVPLNRRHPIRKILEACRVHSAETGKRITIEYVLIPGVNDAEKDALRLAPLLRGMAAKVNLIGFNPFPGAPFRKPSTAELIAFRGRLARTLRGPVVIRRSRGADIQGACGQLSGLRHPRGGKGQKKAPDPES